MHPPTHLNLFPRRDLPGEHVNLHLAHGRAVRRVRVRVALGLVLRPVEQALGAEQNAVLRDATSACERGTQDGKPFPLA